MEHLPVLLNEVIASLNPESGDIVLDATCGGGGHSEEILQRIIPNGRLIAVDKDPEAIERIKNKFSEYKDKIYYFNADFKDIGTILDSNNISRIDKALFDLGMSSFQVDDSERGFSFLKDGPLDMRFNYTEGPSAEAVINTLSEEELKDIIKEFGEERYAYRVAKNICKVRKDKCIKTTAQLKDIIVQAIGSRYGRQRLHPAARTFQAIRIYVNDELRSVEKGVTKAIEHLNPGGRICVISFHSLEDRIIKNIFRNKKKENVLNVLTKKPVIPEKEEMMSNPRSRSAKMRAAERI